MNSPYDVAKRLHRSEFKEVLRFDDPSLFTLPPGTTAVLATSPNRHVHVVEFRSLCEGNWLQILKAESQRGPLRLTELDMLLRPGEPIICTVRNLDDGLPRQFRAAFYGHELTLEDA